MALPEPRGMRSVFSKLPVFQTGDAQLNMDRAVQAAGYIDTAKTAARRYREAVLAHPDLANRLQSAFGYRTAGQWNGYVPAYLEPSHGRPSPSPHRALLVELVTEALKRNDDWQDGDSDRLAFVPERLIRSPWTDDPYSRTEARIAQILGHDEDD